MANDNDMAILAESLSEIREAIERVATAIKMKESSTVVVVNSDERESAVQEISQTPQSQRPMAEELPALQMSQEITVVVSAEESQSEEIPPTSDEAPVPFEQYPPRKDVRATRVEHQILVRDPDGSQWLLTTRRYSDDVFRQDRRLYKSPVGSPVGTKKI
jgi:hypothetical protein